jgi:hypothetical protein
MEKTWMPVVAGILCITAGGLSLLGGLFAGAVASIFFVSSTYTGPGEQFAQTAIVWLAFLPYVADSAVAIAGGIFSLKRRVWGLALAGAICTFFTIWAWPLGVAAIVFVASSRPEFNHFISGPPQGTPPPSQLPPSSSN